MSGTIHLTNRFNKGRYNHCRSIGSRRWNLYGRSTSSWEVIISLFVISVFAWEINIKDRQEWWMAAAVMMHLRWSGRKNIIIDHCSMSWSTDEVFQFTGDSTTLQWNIISEPLNYSYHFETGDKDCEKHGFGGIWGGKHLSAHHNLFAHCNNRNPRFNGNRHGQLRNLLITRIT